MAEHVFNDLEGLRIAAEMERRGEALYRRAALLTQNEAARNMLLSLAKDEVYHGAEFVRLYNERKAAQKEVRDYDDETNTFLSALAADIVFPGGLMAMRKEGFEDISAVIDYAIQSEKDSVLFYTELAEHAADDEARNIFLEIAKQERQHMCRLAMRKLSAQL